MWEAIALTLCAGAPAPDLGNCIGVENTWGPYATKEACLARVEEMKETLPLAFAIDIGYSGPVSVLSEPEGCVQLGETA